MKTNAGFKTTFNLGGDLKINRLGYGAMRITGPMFSGMPENPQNSLNVVKRAVELGVNFIDTADAYGPFTSEELIRKALFPYREDIVIGTKGGLVRFGAHVDFNYDASPQHLHDALDGSLRRLKLEQIDLYQLHRIDPKVPAEITFEFLADAQRAGKIRHLGLSEVSVEEIKLAQQYFKVASVQNRYSFLDRKWETVLNYTESEGIAFIPWFPTSGVTTSKSEVIQQTADFKGVSTHQLALSWLLHRAENILLIPGTSNILHLEENMRCLDIQFSTQEMNDLNSLSVS